MNAASMNRQVLISVDEQNVRKHIRGEVRGEHSQVTEPGPSNEVKETITIDDSDEDDNWTEVEGWIMLGGMMVSPAPPPHSSRDTTGPRLIITHVMIENFKGYAGRVMLGPFDKYFTSIIGSNDCGKSSILDSLLFVLGYGTADIPPKKISVLIHKSEEHNNVRCCTVEIHFAKINYLVGEDYQILPNSELVVAKTAFADNNYCYTINGKESQFKEVATMLSLYKFDLLHNKFFVMQGEVERMSLMKIKAETVHDTDILNYLDGIIGTSRYKELIDKLGAKVNELVEERQLHQNRVKFSKNNLEALRKPMLNAVKFLQIENKRTVIQNSRHQKQIFDLENKLKGLDCLKKEQDKKMADIEVQLKDTLAKRIKNEEEICDRNKNIECMANEKDTLSDKLRAMENQVIRLEEEIKIRNKQQNKTIESKDEEEAKLVELETGLVKIKKELEELTSVEKQLEADKVREEAFMEQTISNLSSDTMDLQKMKEKLSHQLVNLRMSKWQSKANCTIAQSELDIYLLSEKKEKAKLERIEEWLQTTRNQMKECKLKMPELESKISDAERQLEADQTRLNFVKTHEPKVINKLRRMRVSVDEKQKFVQADTLKKNIFSFISDQKRQGHLLGVLGRLGDLACIDSKYDVAISTVCDPLDYIVVDSARTEAECANALKSKKIGKAHIISLDHEQPRNKYKKLNKTPENVPRLFDLIKVDDERLKPVFYSALGNILVVKDMDQAIRVAYGETRHRVVTLTGETIEISGTMSGGGNQMMCGRMRCSTSSTTSNQLKIKKQDNMSLEQMKQRVSELEETMLSYQRLQVQLEPTIYQLKKNLQSWKMDYASLKVEVEGLSTQESGLMQQVMDQQIAVKAIAPDPSKVSQLTTKVDNLKIEFDRESILLDKIESEVARVTLMIQTTMRQKMADAQSKLDEVSKKTGKVRGEMTRLRVAINSSGRNLTKISLRVETLTTEIMETEDFLKKADSERLEREKECCELTKKIELLSNNILASSQAIESLRSEISNLVILRNRIRTMKLNEDQDLDCIIKAIRETQDSIFYHKEKLAALKLQEIPDWSDNEETVSPLPQLVQLSPQTLEKIDLDNLLYRIRVYDQKLDEMTPNLRVLADYQKAAKQLKGYSSELDTTIKRLNKVHTNYNEMRKARLNEFMVGFRIISKKVKEIYKILMLGGDAELIIKESDPFSGGISFRVRPPQKSWVEFPYLSGGEKTMSSLALLFTHLKYRPTPICVMDAIDETLDLKNVSLVSEYIKKQKKTQFIIISFRKNMFKLATLLIGVYKTSEGTKTITIAPSAEDPPLPFQENNEDRGNHTPSKMMKRS